MASLQSSILRYFIRKSNLWNKPLEEVRQKLEGMGGKIRFPKNIEKTFVSAGGVCAEWIVPSGAVKDRVIVYLHGGGYCLGIYNINRNFVAKIAKETNTRVLLVDYRLAPENPYPAAIEDALSAYRWLLGEGYLPENMVMIGDSSGCGLTLVALTALRDQGEAMPAASVFMSPTVDFKYTGESMETRAQADPYQLDPKFYIANDYVANNDPSWPLISPLYGDLHGLPPMLIHASDYDVLLSDALRLSEKAKESGVDVSMKVWDKMWHNFHMSADLLPEGKAALKEIYAYIEDKIG